MQRSLTVLLPVHNDQSTLNATVAEVLEIAPELTDLFELVIVDDGSSDATSEIAHELTSRYPQVRAVYHSQRMGWDSAVRTGLQQSSGEIVLLREEGSGACVDEIAKLWHAAHAEPDEDRSENEDRPEKLIRGKKTRLSAGHTTQHAGYRMIDRRLDGPTHSPSQPIRPNYFLNRIRKLAIDE